MDSQESRYVQYAVAALIGLGPDHGLSNSDLAKKVCDTAEAVMSEEDSRKSNTSGMNLY